MNFKYGNLFEEMANLSEKRYITIVAAQGANPRLVTSFSEKNKVELLQG
jgi:hypothetical protein